MTLRIDNVVCYAQNPRLLAEFWSAALGYPIVSFEGEFADRLRAGGLDDAALENRVFLENPDGGAGLIFRHTPVPRESRNRLHFDVEATPGRRTTPEELDAVRDELVALGASVVRLLDTKFGPFDEHYYQMLDPEGNEFCLI